MRNDTYTDHGVINWVMDHCKILHLGLTVAGTTYVVPVNYGYNEDPHGHYTIFIHGTNDGQKAAALDKEPVIGFESDGGHEQLTYTPPVASAFGPAYRSIMGKGKVTRIQDNQEKLVGLKTIIHHYVRDIPAIVNPDDLDHVAVWKIEVDDISARVHHPTAEWQRVLHIQEPIAAGYHYDHDGNLIKVDGQNDESSTDTGASASVKDHH